MVAFRPYVLKPCGRVTVTHSRPGRGPLADAVQGCGYLPTPFVSLKKRIAFHGMGREKQKKI